MRHCGFDWKFITVQSSMNFPLINVVLILIRNQWSNFIYIFVAFDIRTTQILCKAEFWSPFSRISAILQRILRLHLSSRLLRHFDGVELVARIAFAAVRLGHKWCFGVWPRLRFCHAAYTAESTILAWLPPEETLKKDRSPLLPLTKAPPIFLRSNFKN